MPEMSALPSSVAESHIPEIRSRNLAGSPFNNLDYPPDLSRTAFHDTEQRESTRTAFAAGLLPGERPALAAGPCIYLPFPLGEDTDQEKESGNMKIIHYIKYQGKIIRKYSEVSEYYKADQDPFYSIYRG